MVSTDADRAQLEQRPCEPERDSHGWGVSGKGCEYCTGTGDFASGPYGRRGQELGRLYDPLEDGVGADLGKRLQQRSLPMWRFGGSSREWNSVKRCHYEHQGRTKVNIFWKTG